MMRRAVVLALACSLAVVPLTPLGSSRVAHAQRAAVASVPLESLPLIQPSQVVVIPPGNSANYQGQPITHGLQLQGSATEDAHALLRLDKRYTRLTGTVYVDDSYEYNYDFTAFRIYDESNVKLDYEGNYDPTAGRILFNFRFTTSITSATFTINVSKVSLISLYQWNGSGSLDVVATLTPSSTSPSPAPAPTHVRAISPTISHAVPTNRAVLFQWHPFKGAAAYQLHTWLVHPLGNSPVQRGTPTTFATTVYGKTSYRWSDQGFRPGLYRYDLLPVNGNGYALADWSAPTDFKIIG